MNATPREINLYRDGPSTAWGFRLQGGVDVGLPLTVMRVNYGSPSNGELYRGDIITKIGNKDASRMSHQAAHNVIKSAGNNLNMTVLRSGQHGYNSPAHNVSYYGGSLPRSDFKNEYRRFVPPPPQNHPSALNAEVAIEKKIERHNIVNQPHRTFPLITPSIKVNHDVPTGSYLRYVNDPFTKHREPQIPQSMKAKIQESVLNAGGYAYSAGSSPARSATPEVIGTIGPNTNIVHRQYNSPLPLYSHQNVLETIAGQTGVTPDLADLIKGAILEIAQDQPDSAPRVKELKFFDITKSPTYQAILEQEYMVPHKTDFVEHKPVEKVKIIHSPTPTYLHEDGVNPLGVPKDKILQSRSFELIQNTLTSQSDF